MDSSFYKFNLHILEIYLILCFYVPTNDLLIVGCVNSWFGGFGAHVTKRGKCFINPIVKQSIFHIGMSSGAKLEFKPTSSAVLGCSTRIQVPYLNFFCEGGGRKAR